MAFLDQILVYFGALVEVLMDQRREFFRSFEVLCTKTLIDYHTTSKNQLEHSKNCVLYHLHIDDFIHLQLVVVRIGLPYFICDKKKGVAAMFLYNQCQYGWHMAYLTPTLLTLKLKD
uniref:Uncharacterized protein n=1 Tax=Physcomitrium patens TaxID=3218 RepID=A0A2K1IVY3_PHYPA|nr:hypothetical protein PHYPA_025374 [Physcomitrium patens]